MGNLSFDLDYLDQNNREHLIKAIAKKYAFLKLEVLGKSYCERDIHCIKIGNPQNACLLVGGFHGMEWLTSLLLLRFVERLADSIKYNYPLYGINLQKLLAKKGAQIVPCINPDGTEISIRGAKSANKYRDLVEKISRGNTSNWQANARGVDINHNFDAKWEELHSLEQKNGITGPAPTRFGGNNPESELETQILTDLCRKGAYRHAIAFHSQGEEIYWDFDNRQPENSHLMAHILSQTSGYALSEPEGLAVGGGFKDWFIEKFNRPAFTIEIGKGQNPLPISEFNNIYTKLGKMLVFSIIL
ncbi:MAG: M14 family metallocarboxypeptidase [Clostridia bacterium]|nr:M14 family metallocarboxypeptidase [Clostridia bacterium]